MNKTGFIGEDFPAKRHDEIYFDITSPKYYPHSYHFKIGILAKNLRFWKFDIKVVEIQKI